MMASLHLNVPFLTNMHSIKIVTFNDPLILDTVDPQGLAQVKKGVKLQGPPDGNAHVGGDVRAVVFFPRESTSAKENLLWD